MAPPIIVTEDTPPDMLAGSMDLNVVLPDGHSLKMNVERSTPMMDLLVQVTTANKISPAGHIIKPLNQRGLLPYKPSTPIGALDAWTIQIMPKQHVHCTSFKKPLKLINQPFEQTFRLQVHLPRNQLYVTRVSPNTRLADIFLQVCTEKNLDPIKYSLRHPSRLDQVLSLACNLADYKLQEVTLVCNRNYPVEVSTVDIMSLQRETSNPAYRNTMCEGSVSSGSLEGRSLSPVPSDESSASPPLLPPSRPLRKRRPAPKPPITKQKALVEDKQENGTGPSTMVYHSRNSSDSSGYHEASVLSESPHNNSVAVELAGRSMEPGPTLQQATSTTSLSSVTGRKKKTAPPPPSVAKKRTSSLVDDKPRTPSVSSTESSTTTLDGNEGKVAVKSATLPPGSRLNSVPPPSSPPPTTVDVEPQTTPQGADVSPSEFRMTDEEIDRIFSNSTKGHTFLESNTHEDPSVPSPTLPSPPCSLVHCELKQQTQTGDPLDWEYRLPAPPTFRDENKSPIVTEFGTVTIGNLSNILAAPEVNNMPEFTKTEKVTDRDEFIDSANLSPVDVKGNEISDTNIDENSGSLSKYKRSSGLVELNTDVNEKDVCPVIFEQDVLNELSSTLNKRPSRPEVMDLEVKQISKDLAFNSTLDNFTITTYKDSKPVEVFEDDSIKSSVGEKRDKSKDDAVFRAPKPRVMEPTLIRTNSFSIENKCVGPVVKRSVSYVSLLAANMPRHSQPYRALLQRQAQPPLRKTTSEISIDIKDDAAREFSLWQENESELQSVQVMRNILSKSQASLSSSQGDLSRDPLPPGKKIENTVVKKDLAAKWERTQSEEQTMRWTPKPRIENSISLDQEYSKSFTSSQREQPQINLSTWGERPKRQVSIKNDRDYTSGFAKNSLDQDETQSGLHTTNIDSVNSFVGVRLKEKNGGFNWGGKSKSISDLSRIPIVRAVELKKSFPMNNFNKIALKPVKQISEAKNSEVDNEKSETDDSKFIGVSSLAMRFGVPNKRPASLYARSYSKSLDMETGHREIISNTGNNFDNANLGNNIGKTVLITAMNPKEANESQIKVNIPYKRSNSTISEIKAQAKIRSGGFVEDVPAITSSTTVFPEKNIFENSSRNEDTTCNEYILNKNRIKESDSNLSVASKVFIPSNSLQVTSSTFLKQTSLVDIKPRPVSLQPVVKGFRVSTETNSTVPREYSSSLSSNTKEFGTSPSNLTNLSHPIGKTLYHRAMSTPTVKESAKDRMDSRVKSVPSSPTKGKLQSDSVIPAPPPMMPILKPVGERKGVKLLPPPAANPRDLLMHSIRSFGKDQLKRVSS